MERKKSVVERARVDIGAVELGDFRVGSSRQQDSHSASAESKSIMRARKVGCSLHEGKKTTPNNEHHVYIGAVTS